MRPTVFARLIALGLLPIASSPAAAHAFLRRYDLPLPLWHYLVGAGFIVVLTFVFLTIFRTERSAGFTRRIDLSETPLIRFLTRSSIRKGLACTSVFLFFFIVAAGIFGTQEDPFKNILPVFIWVVWWVGFAFLSAVVGDAWPAVNP